MDLIFCSLACNASISLSKSVMNYSSAAEGTACIIFSIVAAFKLGTPDASLYKYQSANLG